MHRALHVKGSRKAVAVLRRIDASERGVHVHFRVDPIAWSTRYLNQPGCLLDLEHSSVDLAPNQTVLFTDGVRSWLHTVTEIRRPDARPVRAGVVARIARRLSCTRGGFAKGVLGGDRARG